MLDSKGRKEGVLGRDVHTYPHVSSSAAVLTAFAVAAS